MTSNISRRGPNIGPIDTNTLDANRLQMVICRAKSSKYVDTVNAIRVIFNNKLHF